MKFSTRARYGLRMMIELTRLLDKEPVVHLGRVAKITGLSENYLAQLAISLKNSGLLRGIPGKKGGYQLSRPADEIKVGEIIQALSGTLTITDCVEHPEICHNSGGCEARAIWALVSISVMDTLNEYSLEDLLNKNWLQKIREQHVDSELLNFDLRHTDNSITNTPEGLL